MYSFLDHDMEKICTTPWPLRDAFPEILFNEEIVSWSKYGPDIVKAYDEYWVKLIITSNFDATFNEFMNQIKSRGIDYVVEERMAYYKKYF